MPNQGRQNRRRDAIVDGRAEIEKEIKRRADVVGISPNDEAVVRLSESCSSSRTSGR